MECKISIIIPVYNAKKYLEVCLDSIIAQTYSNYEVVIVNDGSTDNSLEICKKYCEQSTKFVLVDQKNQGVDKARNNALSRCVGDYIAFFDSDDSVEPKWLEIYINAIKKNPSSDWLIQGLLVDYGSYIKETKIKEGFYEGNSEGYYYYVQRGTSSLINRRSSINYVTFLITITVLKNSGLEFSVK